MIPLGIIAAARAVGGGGSGDPHWANVTLLAHADGSSGSTSVTDSSGYGASVYLAGSASLTSADSKFGTTSIALDGDGDAFVMSGSSGNDFSTGDFTIEFFVKPTGALDGKTLLRKGNSFFPIGLFTEPSGSISLRCYSNSNASLFSATTGNAMVSNSWNYVAVTRSGSSFSVWINGTLGASATSASDLKTTADALWIGTDPSDPVYGVAGYVDEIRLTLGVARDVSVVPTAPFPTGSMP